MFPSEAFFFLSNAKPPAAGGKWLKHKHLGYALNKLFKGFSLAVLLTPQTLFFFSSSGLSGCPVGWQQLGWAQLFLPPVFSAFDVVLLFVRESH